MIRHRLIAAAALSVLALAAGCNRERAAKAPAPAANTAAASARPLKYESTTPYAVVSLTLPDIIRSQPAFHTGLYDEEVLTLQRFSEGSQADIAEYEGEEDGPQRAHEKTLDVTPALETGRLLSLRKVDFEDVGGAHPTTTSSGLLWDKIAQRRIGFAELFGSADTSALDQALCSAINAAKRARAPDSESVSLSSSSSGWTCPKASETELVLAPGSVPGKAAGLIFLIGPYQVGSYAEGAYDLALPLSAFRAMLRPEYAAEFDGVLTRAGDVTPTA